MKLISHRGNINGPNKEQENHPDYITSALKQGYDVEVDVWLIDGNIVLGHDEPQYDLGPPQSEMWFNFLAPQSHKLWLHCKNLEALGELFKYRDLNVFWHMLYAFQYVIYIYIYIYLHVCVFVYKHMFNLKFDM